jgi:hypothetical protein
MNIADRPRLYGEVRRVLKLRGWFVAYDLIAKKSGPVHFPVPWSRTARDQLPRGVRLHEERARADWVQVLPQKTAPRWPSAGSSSQQKARAAAQAGAPACPPPLGLHVAMGSELIALSAKRDRNLREGRVAILQAVLDRP